MEILPKITGTWRGAYIYEGSNDAAVPFTLILKQGWFGRFTGSVTEDAALGMPGTGTIAGHFTYPHISFIKQMPVCYVPTPDGRNISLREYLLECGHACERDFVHPTIRYQGEFANPRRAEGTWVIEAMPVLLGDGNTIQMFGGRGLWFVEA